MIHPAMRLPGLFAAACTASLVALSAHANAQPNAPQPPSAAATDADPEPTPPASSSDRAAARPNATNRELAVVHYERGRSLYAAGRYREAVFELETAYSLDRTGTNLLLNLGMVHERLGHIDDAILAYSRHLASSTDEAERTRTQRILTRLRGARAELADMSRRHGRADGLFWAAAGGAVASTTIGAAMFATQRAGSNSAAPVIFTATGASLGVLALVLYFARESPERHTLFVSAGPSSVGLAGTF
jgi:tetratricopeptide (TPR) repeat protein